MDKIFILVGIGAGYVYLNYEKIKLNYLKYEATSKSKQLVVNFFKQEIKKDPFITLEDAILKFEDPNLNYKSLDEMSKKKGRSIECYIKAYENLFSKAKKNLNY